jgi:hypothetical protein
MAHIFDLCFDDPVTGEFRTDNYAGTVTDSGVSASAANRSVREF